MSRKTPEEFIGVRKRIRISSIFILMLLLISIYTIALRKTRCVPCKNQTVYKTIEKETCGKFISNGIPSSQIVDFDCEYNDTTDHTVCKFIFENRVIISKGRGNSMKPLLDDDDLVVEQEVDLPSELHVGDFVKLYNTHGVPVIHQIVFLSENKTLYQTRGLNSCFNDTYKPIPVDNIVSKVIGIFSG